MKAFHLYQLKSKEDDHTYYLYVVQKMEYIDSMDILAIRSDFKHGAFPLYSPAIENIVADLGTPTVDTLIKINEYFYSAIMALTTLTGLNISNMRNDCSVFLWDTITSIAQRKIESSDTAYNYRNNNRDYHCLASSINRIWGTENAKKYIENKYRH